MTQEDRDVSFGREIGEAAGRAIVIGAAVLCVLGIGVGFGIAKLLDWLIP